nr:hypothetical protein [Tanacetum cinerariifolium]
MHFLLSIMIVVYVLTTLIPNDGDDATMDQIKKKAKFTLHKMNMDQAIQVSCIIDKLHPSWKDFKHTLKHLKEELTLVELGSHIRIEESLGAKDSDKPKGNNDVIFDENRFSSVLRPSLSIPKRTETLVVQWFLKWSLMRLFNNLNLSLEKAKGIGLQRMLLYEKKAINDEMESIMGNNTLVWADVPLGCKPIGCKWNFKRKLKVDGTIEEFKARLMDVKTAFLNGDLDEEVYMNQPLGFIMSGNENKEADVILGIRIKHEMSTPMDTSEKLMPNNGQAAGKRFAFVRFIKVFDLDRLVKNLCTIWIGRHHLFANQSRFERPPKPTLPPHKGTSKNSATHGHSPLSNRSANGHTGSFVNAVNGVSAPVNSNFVISSSPALVLEDICLVEWDVSKCAIRKVKDVHSLSNILILLNDEGFTDITPKYLGGLSVLLKFGKQESKKNFMDHSGVNSWLHLIQDVPLDFVSDERIAWVDIEGVPLQAWSRETFSKISNKWGELMSIEDTYVASFGRKRELFTWSPNFLGIKENLCSSDDESISGGMHNSNHSFMSEEEEGEFNPSDKDVPETIFGDNSASKKGHSRNLKKQMSEDPFGIYKTLKKNRPVGDSQPSPSLSRPPG